LEPYGRPVMIDVIIDVMIDVMIDPVFFGELLRNR
jgi:hypothetical protein